MVSTPIGAPNSPSHHVGAEPSQSVANQGHSFPVLYTSPPIGANLPTEATPTPISLYSEYMGNPYTLSSNTFSVYGPQPMLVYPNLSDTSDSIVQTAADMSNAETNIFQSSNYFYTDPNSTNIPVGSEILFGTGSKT